MGEATGSVLEDLYYDMTTGALQLDVLSLASTFAGEWSEYGYRWDSHRFILR
jgi:hypothetical protein